MSNQVAIRNNNRRRVAKSNGRRRVNRAGIGARPPTAVITRNLHRLANVNLSTSNPNGGTEHFFQLGAALDEFEAHSQLVEQYEQYKITNIKIWARPNAQNVGNIADPISQIGACFALKNYSVAETFIDYDSQIAPSQSEILRRDKVSVIKLDHDGWKQLASFTPKVRFDTETNALPALVTSNDWLSTNYPELNHIGLRGVLKQDSGFWGSTSTTSARVTFYITLTVQFRGLKSG